MFHVKQAVRGKESITARSPAVTLSSVRGSRPSSRRTRGIPAPSWGPDDLTVTPIGLLRVSLRAVSFLGSRRGS